VGSDRKGNTIFAYLGLRTKKWIAELLSHYYQHKSTSFVCLLLKSKVQSLRNKFSRKALMYTLPIKEVPMLVVLSVWDLKPNSVVLLLVWLLACWFQNHYSNNIQSETFWVQKKFGDPVQS